MPDGAGMFSRQIPAYAGLTSGQIPGVRPGGIIAVGIDSYIIGSLITTSYQNAGNAISEDLIFKIFSQKNKISIH
jgi:hypothetical protein